MLHSDVNLEQRVIDSMTNIDCRNAYKAGIKCIVALDIMEFLRNKKDTMHFRQTIDFNINGAKGLEGFVSNKLVLFSNASVIKFPCDFFEEKGIMVFYFTEKAITYHTLLCMCEVIGIAFGEVVPEMLNSWTE